MEESRYEGFLKELTKEWKEASEEERQRGKELATRWAFRRLSLRQRRELQHARYE